MKVSRLFGILMLTAVALSPNAFAGHLCGCGAGVNVGVGVTPYAAGPRPLIGGGRPIVGFGAVADHRAFRLARRSSWAILPFRRANLAYRSYLAANRAAFRRGF